MDKSRCTFLGNTTSIQVICNHPTSMKEQRKSTILLDLQIFQIHRTSFNDVSQLPRTHMLIARDSSLTLFLDVKLHHMVLFNSSLCLHIKCMLQIMCKTPRQTLQKWKKHFFFSHVDQRWSLSAHKEEYKKESKNWKTNICMKKPKIQMTKRI